MVTKLIALCFYAYVIYMAICIYLSILKKEGKAYNRLMHHPKTFIVLTFSLPFLVLKFSFSIASILKSWV